MNASARPAARFAISAAAALVLGTGLAAAGAASEAHAATRPTREVRTGVSTTTGGLSTGLVAQGDGLAVHTEVASLSEVSYVQSTVAGKVTLACFADGQVVRGTGVNLGWVRLGLLAPSTDGSGGAAILSFHDSVGSKDVAVPLLTFQHDHEGDLAAVDCAEGSTAGWYRFQVSSVASKEYTLAGSTLTGTSTNSAHHTYYFPAPTA